MIDKRKRISFFASFMILTVIGSNLMFVNNQKSDTLVINPLNQKDRGLTFSFYHQFLKFEIDGNYNSIIWNLYRHNLVKNSSYVVINSTLYVKPVTLKLDIGFYTLQIEVNSTNPVTVTTYYSGVSERSVLLSALITVITFALVIIISLNQKKISFK